MKVTLGNYLEEYLHEHHHNTISLELALKNEPHVGEMILSTPRMPEPRMIFSKPVNESHFNKYSVDDITIYVAKNIEAEEDELEIIDLKVDGMDTCHVRGWVGNTN